jgi:lipoprotein-releasing system permease protein
VSDRAIAGGNGAVERWLAWRYLATRQREGFVSFIAIFSLVGIALGVATLIIVLSVMGGFRASLIGRLIGMNGHIVITAKDSMLQTSPELLAALRNTPEVKTVRLTLERQALVGTPNGQTRGALLRGVRLEDLTSREIVTKNIVQGELGAFDTRPGVVIGERLRQGLGLNIGDKITVTTHRLNESGTIAPRYADYEVLASFLTRRYEFDNALVFVPLQMLQDDLEYDNRTVSSIDLELADPNRAPQVAETIRKDAEARRSQGRRLADAQRPLRRRPAGRAGDDVHHPDPDRAGGGDERGRELHHAGAGQARQHRHPAHHGRGAGHHRARLLHVGCGGRHRRHSGRHGARPAGLRQHWSDRPLHRQPGRRPERQLDRDRVHHLRPVRVQPSEVLTVIAITLVLSLAAAAYPAWRSTKVEPVEALRNE